LATLLVFLAAVGRANTAPSQQPTYNIEFRVFCGFFCSKEYFLLNRRIFWLIMSSSWDGVKATLKTHFFSPKNLTFYFCPLLVSKKLTFNLFHYTEFKNSRSFPKKKSRLIISKKLIFN
jgi:hypothetical protein